MSTSKRTAFTDALFLVDSRGTDDEMPTNSKSFAKPATLVCVGG